MSLRPELFLALRHVFQVQENFIGMLAFLNCCKLHHFCCIYVASSEDGARTHVFFVNIWTA